MRKLTFLFFTLIIGCRNEPKTNTTLSSDSCKGIISGIMFGRVNDTVNLFPIAPSVSFTESKTSDSLCFYQLVIKGKNQNALTIDTSGNMVITDSLEVIRTFLWFLKDQMYKNSTHE